MKPVPSAPPHITFPGKTNVFRAYGDEATFLLEGQHTGGRYTMFVYVTPPGGGPPPHYHATEDEWWHVLEGTASFLADGQWVDVTAGGAVFMPKGNVHTFKNNTDRPLSNSSTLPRPVSRTSSGSPLKNSPHPAARTWTASCRSPPHTTSISSSR